MGSGVGGGGGGGRGGCLSPFLRVMGPCGLFLFDLKWEEDEESFRRGVEVLNGKENRHIFSLRKFEDL